MRGQGDEDGRANLEIHSGNAIATSCKDCKSRHFDAQWIECSCMDVTGAYKSTSLDLSRFWLLRSLSIFFRLQITNG
jgi:hypothetical protein